MSYMVIFRTADGKPGYQQADDVQEAVAAVERMRNEDGTDNVRIYRMQEVPFEYKVQYVVELADDVALEDDAAKAEGVDDGFSEPFDSTGPTSEAPKVFDQQTAINHNESPRWDDPVEDRGINLPIIGGMDGEGDGTRKGLFGR